MAAIRKAMLHTDKGEDSSLIEQITDHIAYRGKSQMSVEAIQDAIELELMKSARKDVAQKYIAYRNQRNIARKAKTRDVFMSIVNAKNNDITRENANMNADTPAGMMMKFASETTKPFVDDYLLSQEVRDAVTHNYIHIHDKDYYPTKSLTCVQHPLDIILQAWFHSRPWLKPSCQAHRDCSRIGMYLSGNLPERDARRSGYPSLRLLPGPIRTHVVPGRGEEPGEADRRRPERPLRCSYRRLRGEAAGQAWKGKERLEQHAINKTVNRVHQAMEAFIHNMNTIHSRGGNQVVFSSINYGTDTSAEGRCIMREILLSTYQGVGNGETAIFPIQIWKKKRGVNYLPEDRNYDLYQLACKVTARRFFPNFLNLDATFNQNEKWRADDPERYKWEIATMGCRTRVFEDRWGEKTSIARGNLSFSTINIVKLAIECMGIENKQQRIDMFFAKLDNILDITAKQLDERFQFQKTAMAKQFPLLMKYLWVGAENLKPEETIESVINHGTLGIGFIGLAECLVALIGQHHGESEEAQDLGLKIITYMRDRANEFSEQYHHNYSILATPAEGLSGKFTKKDRKQFGIIPGVTDRDYYTNSNHVPVYYKCTALKKAKIEAPYHNLTRGGHIFYVEIDGDATHNPAVISSVVDMMDKYNMGYGSVNHNRNRCLDCGYENADANLEVCPKCGSHHIDKLQRITGYLVGTNRPLEQRQACRAPRPCHPY